LIEIRYTPKGNSLIVSLIGRLDTATAPLFDRKFKEDVVASGHKYVVLDLRQLDYISSLGLSSILIGNKAITDRDGELVLCGLEGIVRQVFQITGLASVLKIFLNPDAAVEEFDRGRSS
jgi:anti-anti-sigma factor